ncbi:MAG: hypothetical protein K8T10_00685 [Candidatus Eremiobacteraeota bacterium]|nr:hypothetical protein [Candidatus Eremiobacteraeota bacterium]
MNFFKLKKKYIIFLVVIGVILILYFGIKALIKSHKMQKQRAAWKIYKQAEAKFQEGKANEALSVCEKAYPDLVDDKLKAECISLMAECHGKSKRVLLAEDKFKEAVKLAPTDYKLHLRFGRMYLYNAKYRANVEMANREYVKALEQLNDAQKFCPLQDIMDRQDILFHQADVLEKLKIFAEAQNKYKQMVKLGDTYPTKRSRYYEEAKTRLEELEKE